MYPSLYYAVKDLFGLNLPFLKMFQSFGFFVALAFMAAAYVWTKELKRKEGQGLLKNTSRKFLKGQKATTNELIGSAVFGFIFGYKLLYIALNFTAFTENTQGFILSFEGNFIGGIAGAIISAYMKYREKEKEKLDTPIWVEETLKPHQLVGNMTIVAAVAGLIGAKIFHNLENWGDFVEDPIGSIFSFSGLTMYGGLICGSISVIYYAHKNGIPTVHLVDSSAPAIMLGYAVGRIGCQVAGDGDWGIANTAPKPNWLSWAPDWMWSYDYAHNVNSEGVLMENCVDDRYCYHLVPSVFPTPFYEIVMCLILFFVLWSVRKRITIPGVMFSFYLILNGMERFTIEKIRVNTLYHIGDFSFTQAQLISSILFILGVVGVIYFRNKHKKVLQ
jgi:prolipoprotein diacylglyceryltransferase